MTSLALAIKLKAVDPFYTYYYLQVVRCAYLLY